MSRNTLASTLIFALFLNHPTLAQTEHNCKEELAASNAAYLELEREYKATKGALQAETYRFQAYIGELEENAARYQRLNKDLQKQIARTKAARITELIVEDHFVTNDSAAFFIKSEGFGMVAAKLFRGGQLIKEINPRFSGEIDNEHYIIFSDSISPKHSYTVELEALDANGDKIRNKPTIGKPSRDKLSFSPDEPELPIITIHPPEAGDTTSNQIKLRYEVNAPAFIKVQCQKKIPHTNKLVSCGLRGQLDIHKKLYRPRGSNYYKNIKSIETFTVDQLEGDTNYILTPIAFNRFGDAARVPSQSYEYRTPPTSFDFSGPVLLELDQRSLHVSWNSTHQPLSAFVEFNPSSTSRLARAGIDGLKLSSEVLLEEIIASRKWREKEPLTTTSLLLRMENASKETQTRELRFSFLPQQNPAEHSLDSQKRTLEKIKKMITGNDKKYEFSRKELEDIGLVPLLALAVAAANEIP